MAKENALKFISSMAKNKEVGEKFNQLKTLDEMYDFATKNSDGDFTKEEFSEVFDSLPSIISKLDSGEISEADLDNVSGGLFGFGGPRVYTDNEIKYAKARYGSNYHEAEQESTGRTVVMGLSSIANLVSAFTGAYQTYFQTKVYEDEKAQRDAARALLNQQE